MQKTSPAALDAGTDYDIDTSPPYSPTASEMERPNVQPHIVSDLRQACAIIVNETNPPEPDEEPAHYETLRKFEEERKAKIVAQTRAADVKSQKAEVKSARAEQRAYEKAQKEYARQAEAEARRAAVKQTEAERRKAIERQAELRMGTSADVAQEQASKEQPRRYSTRRPPQDLHVYVPKTEARAVISKGTAAAAERSTSSGPADPYNLALEPLEPTHTKVSSKAQGKQKEVDVDGYRQRYESHSATRPDYLPPVHAPIVANNCAKQPDIQEPVLNNIRASMHIRPKTSAAATVDYEPPSGASSKSTTRSNTEYDNHGRPISTAVTSAILTPGEEKRISYNRQPSDDPYGRRPSDESDQYGNGFSHAKAWQEQKAALRQAEDKYNKSGRAARPASKASKRSRRWGGDSDSEYERPLSRATSVSDSIRSGLSHYLRPRASQDSMRSGRSSATGLSRSESRSSSVSKRSSSGWWRPGGLKKKGSWSSFRSTRQDQDEPSKLRKNGEPNLNRPLPALPGLDQYKETKTHIGQLMKGGARGRKKDKSPRPDAPYPLQQQQQSSNHIRKSSISGPILRNESMERTLHRYRESQIMSEPQRNASSSQTRQDSPLHMMRPESLRHDSETSIARSISRQGQEFSRSHSRQDIPRSRSRNETTLKPAKNRRDSESTATSAKLHNQPTMIRGPSWHKEIEAAVYPRPMGVNKGPIDVRYENGMYVHDVVSPSGTFRTCPETPSPTKKRHGEDDHAERKVGLKGRVGRIFGGRDARIVDNGGVRRVVQRSITAS